MSVDEGWTSGGLGDRIGERQPVTDPIQVLRAWTPPPEQGKLVSGEWTHRRDYSAALAQVEALVQTATTLVDKEFDPAATDDHNAWFHLVGALAPFKENP